MTNPHQLQRSRSELSGPNVLSEPSRLSEPVPKIFVSENPDKLCYTLQILLHVKQGSNGSKRFDKNVAPIDKTFENIGITSNRHKKVLSIFILQKNYHVQNKRKL